MHKNYVETRTRAVANFLDEHVMIDFIEFFRQFYTRDIFFLMSFPRSGNGWIRYLIAEALLLSKGIDLEDSRRSTYKHNQINAHCIITKSGQSFGIEKYFPDYYAIDKEKLRNEYINEYSFKAKTAYIKTHHLVFRKDVKIVHLYRNPKDVCISYFNLANLTNDTIPVDKDSEDFASFFKQSIKIYLDVYYKMLSFYIGQANKNFKNVFLLRMEDMMTNGSECLDNLLNFLHINISGSENESILKRNPKLGGSKIELERFWDEELDDYAEKCMRYYTVAPLSKA